MRSHPSARAVALLAPLVLISILGTAGCAAFEDTIPQRRRGIRLPERPLGWPAALSADETVELPEDLEAWSSRRAAPAAHGPLGDASPVSLELRGMTLADAVRLIAEAAGANVYLDGRFDQVLDASFPSVTLDDALDVLLERNGCVLVEDPPGIFWVRGDDGTEEETARFHVRSIDVMEIAENLTQLVGEDGVVVLDASQNFVMVRGTRRAVDIVEEYLRSADRLKRQVLVEAHILEVTLDEGFDLGFMHEMDGLDVGDGTLSLMQNLAAGTDSFSLVFDDPSIPLVSTLGALARFATFNVISTPRVLAVTNSQAHIEVTTEIPYVQSLVTTDVGTDGAGTASSQQIEFKLVGTRVSIRPIVQEGGVIAMAIDQEVSEVVDFFQGVPVVDARKLTSSFLVANGQTVVLGGLMRESVVESDRGVPLLMDVPFLGRAFRSDVDETQRRELLLFLTPRIVDPREAAALASQYHQRYEEKVGAWGAREVLED